jgi:DNA polymerase-3 subunit beta
MKIKIQIDKIKKSINAIQSICQKKTISDLTQNTLLEIDNLTLTIKATDLEIFIEINVDIEEIITKSTNNKILINARILYDIIKEIEDPEIEIIFNSNSCQIVTKKSQIELNTLEINNFPENQLRIENILHINNKYIIDCISYCVPLSTSNVQKKSTATILFEIEKESFKVTSTDGHCLSHISIKKNLPMLQENIQFLLSKKASSDLKKIMETISTEYEEIFIGKSGSRIIFTGEAYSITIKTINEKFPDYKRIINTDFPNELQCQRLQFIKIAKRLSLFTENKFIPANMHIDKHNKQIQFKIENNSIGRIDDAIDIDEITFKNDSNLSIAVFPPYILKAASEIDLKPNLIIKINERQKPILFSSQDDTKTMIYIVMPMIGV